MSKLRPLEPETPRLNWEPDCAEIVQTNNSAGPGNIVLIETETSAGIAELFCGFGRLGASSEFVAMEAEGNQM